MDYATFEQQLRAEGYTAFAEDAMQASIQRPEHEAGCDVSVLITAGAMALRTAEGARTYRPGESFRMPRGCRHAESTAAEGCQFFIARRQLTT